MSRPLFLALSLVALPCASALAQEFKIYPPQQSPAQVASPNAGSQDLGTKPSSLQGKLNSGDVTRMQNVGRPAFVGKTPIYDPSTFGRKQADK